ncbi:ABC transporter substrate-binding protein [uncultured Cohaesibacter sp.]|uniref:ABC transporter substrate-binding protein n=1 Tax=uncultured Cohaesibacter sp. TaxID=1002546 RepID=UPI0029C8474C|nr:ABC transporter substrate-binding protein [uncultured Cohaesibacter sp.]
MRAPKLVLSTALYLVIGTAAYADKASDSVNMAFFRELESADVYFNTAREGLLLNHSIWDGLLYRDTETGEYKGNLATEWKWIDSTALELKLREGVTFHNGEPFNADDVVYTVNFVADTANGVKSQANVSWMDHAEKVDDYTVRIFTDAPFPAAEEFLAGPVAMYPNEYYAEVGPKGMALKPVGTGPFKVTELEPGKHYVLEKNENYFGGPKGMAGVSKVDIRTLPDINTQIAEFFNGNLDFLWNVPADQAEKLDAMGKFEIVNAPAMRVGYVTMDAAGRSGADNPMTKLKVRQAVYHAIDRQAIVDALLKGSSTVIDSACSPVQFGCAQDLPTYEYDPEKAKALLAEAGYPDGFEIDFYAYRNRPYAEAMMGFLNEVGIKTNFNYLKYAALSEKRAKGEVPFGFLTWGSYSIADASAITSEFFGGGKWDDARDPELHEWLKIADTSTDKEVRKEYYKKTLTKIVEQAYWVPLFTYNVNYAMDKEMSYKATDDELVRFFTFSWK